MKRMLAVLAVLSLIVMPIAVRAQIGDPTLAGQAVNPQSEHNYIGIGGESVNPADGSVTFNLPIQPPTGRGLTMPFSIRYASPESFFVTNAVCGTNQQNCYSGTGLYWNSLTRSDTNFFEVNGWGYQVPNLMFTIQKISDNMVSCPGQLAQQELVIWQTTNYTFQGMDGVSRPLTIATEFTDPQHYGCQAQSWVSPAVTNAHGYIAAMNYPSGYFQGMPLLTVTDPSGTTYTFLPVNGNTGNPGSVTTLTPNSITDRNGNSISFGFNTNTSQQFYYDSLGRAALAWTGPSATGSDTITVPDVAVPKGTQDMAVGVKWMTPISVTLNLTGQFVNNAPPACIKASNTLTVDGINEIDLPNGQKYTFMYDQTYGRVSRITFPDGGYVNYTWGLALSADGLQTASGDMMYMNDSWGAAYLGSTYCSIQYDKPAIIERDVSYDGQNVALKQTFNYSLPTFASDGWHWTSKSTTVKTTDEVSNQTSTTIYTYFPMAPDATAPAGYTTLTPEVPVESSIVYQDASTTKTVYKTWVDYMTESAEQTVLNNSAGTTNVRCYNADEQVVEVDEYGLHSELNGAPAPSSPSCYSTGNPSYGLQTSWSTLQSNLGPLERVTDTAYNFTWSLPTNYQQAGYAGNYSGTHIVNAPQSVTVSDGAGNSVQKTTYAYTDTVATSGTTAAWTTATGATATGLTSPPGLDRGNIQQVTKWYSSTNTGPITSYTYYETGELASQTDACGNIGCSDMTGTNHTTTYVYADSAGCTTGCAPPIAQTNAYITSVAYPDGTGKSFTWDYGKGQLLSATDENNNTTNYQYYGPTNLWRVSQVNSPDGGQTNFTYNDGKYSPSSNSNTPSIVTTKVMNSATTLSSTAARDGMGHTVRTIDAAGNKVDTTYNGMGLVASVTNPYQGNTPSSYKTTYLYDVLGRQTKLTHPDSSTVQTTYTVPTTYSGNCTSVMDENGNNRQSCTDGLGRLTQVLEPNPATGSLSSGALTTGYTYDLRNNLTHVDQWGGASGGTGEVARTFTYDALNELLTANNPETGTVCYGTWSSSNCTSGYDANGNLQQRTDARGVTTKYWYDVRNRLIQKTYMNAPAGTMTSCYLYGSSPNSIGRLIAEWTQPGSCASAPPSTAQSVRYYDAYDKMGRVLTERQCVAGYCTSTAAQTLPSANCTSLTSATGLQYCYDLAGNLLAYSNGVSTATVPTYPQQAILFQQTFDTAGRLSAVYSSWNDTTHPSPLFSNATYSTANALTNWLLGAHLAVTRSYDPARLWVTGQSAKQQ